MGNFSSQCQVEELKNLNIRISDISITDFNLLKCIGQGGYGKVWKVLYKKNNTCYAMKVMSKQQILKNGIISQVLNEKNILSQLQNPFIVNLVAAFQDKNNLYLCLDLMSGGDLRCHLYKKERFTEIQTKFLVACIFISLEYLHQQGIIHRDLKPENLVFDEYGYIRLTDFGMAGFWRPNSLDFICGTLGYVSPEMILNKEDGIGVDYFALGIIAYECMLGKRPYEAEDIYQMKNQLLSKQVQIKRSELPLDWSKEAGDFINKLIQIKVNDRLGTNDPREIMNHPWFNNFDWQMLISKQMIPPYTPKTFIGYSSKNYKEKCGQILKKSDGSVQIQQQFNEFYFNSKQLDQAK